MLPLLLLLQATAPPQLTTFLQQNIGFDAQQLAAIERGEPVVKVLETRDRRDVAVFGVITTPNGREPYVRALRDFPMSLRTPNRTQLGIFSNPATEADVAAVTINGRDVAELFHRLSARLASFRSRRSAVLVGRRDATPAPDLERDALGRVHSARAP